MSYFANSYHGGRNEAYAVGYHTGLLTDIDLRGAYTTAMVAIRYPDWDRLAATTDLGVLAQPDALSVARVRFAFLPQRDIHRSQFAPAIAAWSIPLQASRTARVPSCGSRSITAHISTSKAASTFRGLTKRYLFPEIHA